jgi:hypothetical protein
MDRQRRAYICPHPACVPPQRRFAGQNDPEPRCPEHGRMIPQTNVPYVKPDPDAARTIGRRIDPPSARKRAAKRPAREKG